MSCARRRSRSVLGDQGLQVGDEIGMASELELGLDPILDCRRPQLLEPGRFCPRKRNVGAVGKRGPAPQPVCLPERRRCPCRLAGAEIGPGLLDRALEPVRPARRVGRPAGSRGSW